MKFDEFLSQAWNDHATNAAGVADRLENASDLIESADQIGRVAQLVAHVFGEHLGKWDQGIGLLQKLERNPHYEAQGESARGILRCAASLKLASGAIETVNEFSTSDQIRVLALSAAALSGQNNVEKAQTLFESAVEKAQLGIDKADPANRALAMTGNNLAAGLEEKPNRSVRETKLMIFSAKIARKYWEIAGTWLEVERAEYRLAMTYLSAGDLRLASEHAQSCIETVNENGAESLEVFFGYEALASIEKAKGNQIGFSTALQHMKLAFEKLTADDRKWCENTLKKLDVAYFN